MANSSSARKRARQAAAHRLHNAARRSMFRTAVKKVDSAIVAGDRKAAEDAYKAAVPVIDRVAGQGLIHRNKAARQKSRLNHRIRQMS